jgi:hypothetical protein
MKIIKDSKTTSNSSLKSSCCEPAEPVKLTPFPMVQALPDPEEDVPCCGPKQGPASSPFARPGYKLCGFVDGFENTPVGSVPRVKTTLDKTDFGGTIRARCGISRDQYKVAPGLYGVGRPSNEAPVLVTANYKLTFDDLRKNLVDVDAWILVLDTRGVNVWCAAGKKNFSTDEIIRMVNKVQLNKVVSHNELILPQLGAPGVAAHLVKKGCGFKVQWGPIRAEDIKRFLVNGKKTDDKMRSLTFTLSERLLLVPVEISLIIRPSILLIALFFVLSGICADIFSITRAWERGLAGVAAYGMGVLAGAVFVPAFLQWIPARSFYLKGIYVGVLFGGLNAWLWRNTFTDLELIAMILISVSISSFAAMNFTGTTPYTSPSGVEKEMKWGIPIQAVSALIALTCWVWVGVAQ